MTAAMTAPTTTSREVARGVDVHGPATAALTLLTIVTAIAMCRVFPDWAYLRPMLVVCVGVHATMCTLRLLKAPAWLALPVGLAAVAILLGLIYFRDSTRFGFPSGATIEQFRTSMRLVWRQFPHAVSPVPSEGSFAIAATTALALCAWLADSFAFRAYGRAEAVVPAGVVFVFTSALGVDRNRVFVAALWIGSAILTIAALRMAHSRDDSAWMGKRRQSLWSALPAAIVCALFATTGAAAVAPNLPGAGQKALLDTRNRDGDVTAVVSPLVDIRSRIVNKGNVELFTVSTATPRYLALASLGSFDGTRWSTLGEDVRPADGPLGSIPVPGETITDDIRITRLVGQLAPAPRTATAAAWQGDRAMLWGDETGSLYVDGGLQAGYQYQVSAVDDDPSPDELRAATVSTPPSQAYIDLPKSLPQEIRDLANEVVAGATTPYDQAIALQNWFRTQFHYTTTVQRGHSNDAMINFLQIRQGYCEQFAGTFAAMARVIGLPTRVMVGFTPGQLGSDNLYHVFGRHAHAWDEVWFDGYGWVLFDPTPGRGAPGAEGHTGVTPNQDTSNGTPGGVPEKNTPIVSSPPPSVPARDRPDGGQTQPSTPRNPILKQPSKDGSNGGWIVTGIVLAIIAWVVAMPKVMTRWSRRRAKSAADRVTAAWAAAVRSLSMAGAPRMAGLTPLEYARSVDFGKAEAIEIARLVTRAVYSPRGVDDSAAERSELLRGEVDAACRARMSPITRLLDHLDPRSALGRLTG
jgi:transglutaminase-like putative cysteine protease